MVPSPVRNLRLDKDTVAGPVIRWGEPHSNITPDVTYYVEWSTGDGDTETMKTLSSDLQVAVPRGVKISGVKVMACNLIKGAEQNLQGTVIII